jgi:general stress protein 26
MNKVKLIEYLNKSEIMFLATSANDQPHVRCMALIFYENTIWCCSKSNRVKVQEIKDNAAIEICVLAEGKKDVGSIRGSGTAYLISDPIIREKLSQQIQFFTAYWESPEDDDFTLIKLEIPSFMFHDPDDKQFYTISLNED